MQQLRYLVLRSAAVLAAVAVFTGTARADSQVGDNDFRVSEMGTNGDTTASAFDPAVAYNPSTNQYLVVWSGDDQSDGLADEEAEIHGQLIDAATGQAAGTNDFRISSMCATLPNTNPCRARRPAVAYNSANNEFLVVWEGYRESDLANEFEIFGQRLDSSGAEAAPEFRISDAGTDGNAAFDALSPDVAYNSTTNQYFVVWQGDDNANGMIDGEIEIFGQRLNAATGAELGTNDMRLSDMGPNLDTLYGAKDPSVVFNSTQNEFLVVWSGDDDTASGSFVGEFEIFGQRVSGTTGLEIGTNDFRISDMGSTGDPNFDANAPDVAYNSAANEYLVVWSGDDIVSGLVNEEFEIFGQRLRGTTGEETGENDFRISDMGGNGDPLYDAENPSIQYNAIDNEYLVVWRGDELGADQDFELFAQGLDGQSGQPVGTNDFALSDAGDPGDAGYPVLSPALTFSSVSMQYFAAWQGSDNLAPLVQDELEIFGQRLTTVRDSDNDGAVDSIDADDDNDGLSDVLETGTYFTNPFDTDTDDDRVSDGDEVADGTNPLDRGSKRTVLGSKICLEWNGFLSPVFNIKELVGLGSSSINFTAKLFDVAGRQRSMFSNSVASGGQFDLLVHAMTGFLPDSYGQVCTNHSGNPGDLDGRMVYYKLSPGGSFTGGVEYAFALPFNSGEPGEQFVPFNTFQPSLLVSDSSNLVANWIQISSLNAIPETGELTIYGQSGQQLCKRNLTLGPNQRVDSPAHSKLPGENCVGLGPSLIGFVRWNPHNPAAKFVVRNVRYVYDNPSAANSFTTAFQLEAAPGTGELISAPIDRTSQTVVLELMNVAAVQNAITFRIYNAAGQQVFAKTQQFAPRSTLHVVLDNSISAAGLGNVEVKGAVLAGARAVLMHYGRPANSPAGLQYMYGLPLVEPVGVVQRGSYNTFLGQGCSLYIANPTAGSVSSNVRLVRYDGTVVRSGDTVVVPAHGAALYNCAKDSADKYGVLTLQANTPLSATVVRRGAGDQFRFPTPVR